jgi:hypothetical protein
MLRRTLMLAFALVLVAQPAWAHEYFVSPSGSDAAAGTQQAPWKSVAKVNAASLAPGDVVRFAGGATWNAMLAPAASGTTAAPIVFSTYGAGRAVLDGAGATGYAGIAVTNRSSLVFEHLAVRRWTGDSQGVYLVGAHSVRFTDVVVEDSSEGFHQSPSAPSTGVTIETSRISRIAGAAGSGVGINVTTGSSGYHVTDTVLEHVADSCVIDQGADSLYERITATDCGFGGITYGTHGLYLKGPRQTLRDSTVSGAYTNCISVRFQDAAITGNTVSNCPIGIAWFDSSTAGGTITLLRNRVSDTGTGIYIDSAPTQSFRISHNTIVGGRRSGTTTEGIVSNNALRLAITNNIVTGGIRKVLDISGTGATTYTQRGNALYAPSATYAWNGRFVSSDAALAGLSGQGASDSTVDPHLVSTSPAAPDFQLAAASPGRAAGGADPAGLAVSFGCDGATNHYCGAAPEPGAIELGTAASRVVTHGGDPVDQIADPPANIAASVRGSTATLTWSAPAAGDVGSFLVTANGVTPRAVTTSRIVVRGLHAGRTYTFRVATIDRKGNRSAAVAVRIRVVAPLKASQIRPRVVSATRTSIVVRIPKAVGRGTLRIAGRVIHVRAGLVRIRHLAAGRRYTIRISVAQAGRTPARARVAARTH